jgi:hypothetical protein
MDVPAETPGIDKMFVDKHRRAEDVRKDLADDDLSRFAERMGFCNFWSWVGSMSGCNRNE